MQKIVKWLLIQFHVVVSNRYNEEMYVLSISKNVYLIQRIRRRIVSAKLCFFSTFVNNLKYNDPKKETSGRDEK